MLYIHTLGEIKCLGKVSDERTCKIHPNFVQGLFGIRIILMSVVSCEHEKIPCLNDVGFSVTLNISLPFVNVLHNENAVEALLELGRTFVIVIGIRHSFSRSHYVQAVVADLLMSELEDPEQEFLAFVRELCGNQDIYYNNIRTCRTIG